MTHANYQSQPCQATQRRTIFYDRCRHDLQNKMAAPEASVRPLKIVFFIILPSAQRAKVVHRNVLEG